MGSKNHFWPLVIDHSHSEEEQIAVQKNFLFSAKIGATKCQRVRNRGGRIAVLAMPNLTRFFLRGGLSNSNCYVYLWACIQKKTKVLGKLFYRWLHDSPVRYPNWFNSMFELCRRMIQFNIQFNTISKKSIQTIIQFNIFHKCSIQKIFKSMFGLAIQFKMKFNSINGEVLLLVESW